MVWSIVENGGYLEEFLEHAEFFLRKVINYRVADAGVASHKPAKLADVL